MGQIILNGNYYLNRSYDGVSTNENYSSINDSKTYMQILYEYIDSTHIKMSLAYDDNYSAEVSKLTFKKWVEKKKLPIIISRQFNILYFERKENEMNKEVTIDDLINIANTKGIRRTTAIKSPIELRKVKNHLKLCIRNDVYHFAEKERWSVAFVENYNRLYFFYDSGAFDYKVQESKNGYHFILFTNSKVKELLGDADKKGYRFNFDRSCKAYYIEMN